MNKVNEEKICLLEEYVCDNLCKHVECCEDQDALDKVCETCKFINLLGEITHNI